MSTETKPPEKYNPITAEELTPELIAEALAQSRRYDRNFANKEGSEIVPVPARTARLLALTIIHLHAKTSLPDLAAEKQAEADAAFNKEQGYFKNAKVGKPATPPMHEEVGRKPVGKALPPTPKKAKPKTKAKTVAKKSQSGPPLTPERSKALEACKELIDEKQVITARAVAERGGWASHNTGARHINSLVDLGYLKRVGKSQTLALTGLEP